MKQANTILLGAVAVAAAWGAAAGCASRNAQSLEPVELTQGAVDKFLDGGHDPRKWTITVTRGTGGPEFENGNRPWPGKGARTPMWAAAGGLPAVTAETAAKTKFHALVDTSARQSWLAYLSGPALDYRVFKESDGEPIGEWPDHVKAKIPGYAGVGNKIVLANGALQIESPVFYVAPAGGMLGAVARPEKAGGGAAASWRKQVHAVVGVALLKKFSYVTLDFPGRRIAWASPETKPFSAGAGTEGMPMGDWKGRPAVAVRLGGVEETAVVDTAGDFDVSVPAAALRGVPGGGGRPVEMELVLGGRVAVPRVTVVSHESLGLPGDWPARVGWRVWRNYRMTLDWQHGKLWLTSPEMAAAAVEESAGKDAGGAEGPVRYRGVAP